MRDRAPIRAGFMPLLDCAPLIAAVRVGFTSAEGLDVALVRETSWASIRDRISVRHLDVAHMLAPMPIAANLGLTPLPVALTAPLSLGSGGNTLTVSSQLWSELQDAGAPGDFEALAAAEAFAKVVQARRNRGAARPVFAIVHTYSGHHYQLAYWLAASGLDPRADVEIAVVPPPLMPDALAGGQIDGFCVGEPWGTVAARAGTGRIVTTSAHIWRSSPEKVLGMRQAWADEAPDRLAALVRAVARAAQWCDDPANRSELAVLLSAPDVLDRSAAELEPVLSRRLVAPRGDPLPVEGFLMFAGQHLNEPKQYHAAWLYAQMVRFGHAIYSSDALVKAVATFRPDLYRRSLGVDVSTGDESGATEPVVMDAMAKGSRSTVAGLAFDPSDVAGYLRAASMPPARTGQPDSS